MRRILAALFAGLAIIGAAGAGEQLPLFDAHLHYNWEPKPFYAIDEVLRMFRAHGVTGILATSRPNDGTRALVAAQPEDIRVIPFIRPYRVRADIGRWFDDPAAMDLIVQEHARGGYVGIGEFHLSGRQADTAIVKRVVDFAVANDLYLHAHVDDEALEILYRHNPGARVIWAHTGFSTEPGKVAACLQRYPGLWGELSCRDGITGADGQLSAAWRNLLERHPDRFLIGSDTWIDQRWASYGEIMDAYRHWLAQLPRAAAEQIAFRNAGRLFPPR